MKTTLFALATLVMTSLMPAAHAQGNSRFEQLLNMHEVGPLQAQQVPAGMVVTTEYLCYPRSNPNQPEILMIEHDANQVSYMNGQSEELHRLIGGQTLKLEPMQIPAFNGRILAGRTVSKMPQLLKRLLPVEGVFISLSVHRQSRRNLLAILKTQQDQSSDSSCKNKEIVEYVCLENVSEG